jgi:hypothetical protein
MKILSILVLGLTAVAPVAHADSSLEAAASELRRLLEPHTVTLNNDMVFFHWTHFADASQLDHYVHEVTSDYGKVLGSADYEGPGLYLALEPEVSITYGNHLVALTLKAGTRLWNDNWQLHDRPPIPKGGSIDAYLSDQTLRARQQGRTFPDYFNYPTNISLWAPTLANLPGAGELIRAAGIQGMLYFWTETRAPRDCASTDDAINLIDASAVASAKLVDQDTLTTPYRELVAAGDPLLPFLRLLWVDLNNEPSDWPTQLGAEDYRKYTDWKSSHLMLCSQPPAR